MKLYDKKDLVYRNGYLVKDDEIICVDNEVVDLFNKLDKDLQYAEWVADREAGIEVFGKAFTDEFVPVSEFEVPKIGARTPLLDKAIKDAKDLMDEIDGMASAERATAYFEGIKPVVLFVKDTVVVSFDQAMQHRFDLPYVGDPLSLDLEKLSELVCKIHG